MTHLCFQAKIVPRFEMPDTNDPGRWTNRVVNNLLYYQTNYFVSALVIFFFIRLVNDTSKEEEYIQKLWLLLLLKLASLQVNLTFLLSNGHVYCIVYIVNLFQLS